MPRVIERYEALIDSGELREDEQQRALAKRLDRLQRALEESENARVGGWLARLIDRRPKPVRGVYLWGGVGRGKSMMMDLFCDCLAIECKRRVHFHAFMLEIHQRLRRLREQTRGDPVFQLADEIARELRCLAFDEMVVNNSTDAMIMSRLFSRLIVDHGLVLVTTSNRPPRDLYKNGLNREHFVPFIELIENELDVVALDGPHDYRLERIGGMACWHSPMGERATQNLRELFFRLTDFDPDDAEHVPSARIELGGGRTLFVPKSLKGVGVFSFKRLCAEARGASDYLALAQNFHTVIIVGIPKMGPDMRNEASRFVTLIDALYEHKVKLFASAEAPPEELYPSGDGRFEFERTVSRLKEMQSQGYLAAGHGAAA